MMMVTFREDTEWLARGCQDYIRPGFINSIVTANREFLDHFSAPQTDKQIDIVCSFDLATGRSENGVEKMTMVVGEPNSAVDPFLNNVP